MRSRPQLAAGSALRRSGCTCALSNLHRRAQEEEVVLPGYYPVAALMEKPAVPRREAKWLEMHDAAVLLLAPKALPPRGGTRLDPDTISEIRATWERGQTSKLALARRHGVSNVWINKILEGQEASPPIDEAQLAYPLIATYLLTGGRESEVLGLELDDVSLDRQTITFRPNAWRRLKTPGSHASSSTSSGSEIGLSGLGWRGLLLLGTLLRRRRDPRKKRPAITEATAGSNLGIHGR